MKFLSWLFNFSARHAGDMRRYEKGKTGTRIFVIILLTLLAAATLGVEYWAISLFNENFLYGLLVVILLFIPLVATTIEFCGFYSFVGFRMFFWGVISSAARKADKKIRANKAAAQEDISASEVTEPDTEQERSEKTHKALDLVVGILGILLAIATIVLVVSFIASR
ncbi:MAG: hypothetical protein ACI3XX_04150 [Eubacteriales bacterium]